MNSVLTRGRILYKEIFLDGPLGVFSSALYYGLEVGI